MKTEAYLSSDRLFRYWLLRVWNPALPLYATIGSNPSTADEQSDDPTIRKEIGFGARLNFGGLLKLNVGAFRATKPSDWRRAIDPIGPENTVEHLQGYLIKFAPFLVVAAWGNPVVTSPRGERAAADVCQWIRGMHCWGRNANGTPKHPLMLGYDTKLEPFN